MTVDEALAEIRSVVPADWEAWTFSAQISVKGPHGEQHYGASVHYSDFDQPGQFREWAQKTFGPILEKV